MRNFAFLACFGVLSSLARPASAQVPDAGDLNLQGRVLLKVAAAMIDPGPITRPVSGLTIVVVGAKNERVEIRSDDAGIATAWLFSGTYRIVSSDTVAWKGKFYSWDMIIQVVPGMSIVRLAQSNSASAVASAVPNVGPEPKPITPQPLTPQPLTRQPLTPQPSTPQPSTPQPSTPQPSTPQPSTPEPVAPQPAARQPSARQPSARQPSARQPSQTSSTTRASPTRGQAQRIRQGFWLNAGLGYGRLGCYLCNGYFNGLAAGLSLGVIFSPRVLLGVGTSGWTKSENGVTRTLGTVDGRVRFYPREKGNFFLTAGLGLGLIGSDVSGFGSDLQTGVGALVGIGRDFRVGSHVSLTPFGNAFAIRTADSDASVGQIGLGLTFH